MQVIPKKKRKAMSDINVVPYIDVMLVLLIVFMVTAPLLDQGIEVELNKVGLGIINVNVQDITDETGQTTAIGKSKLNKKQKRLNLCNFLGLKYFFLQTILYFFT